MTAPVAVDLHLPVDVVIVARGAHPYLGRVLDAVAEQTLVPRSVTVVDVSDQQGAAAMVTARSQHPARAFSAEILRTVAAPGAVSFSSAVHEALGGTGTEGDEPDRGDESWLWLLHDDSSPAPGALEALARAVRHAPSVAVAGVKQVRWDSRDRLVEVGFTVTRAGHRLTRLDPGEIDQGQHDQREDVLAVGLAGALVRTEVWRETEGADPVLGPFGDGLDFCVRARRAGHRVIVVPAAVVEHAQLSLRSVEVDEAALKTDGEAPPGAGDLDVATADPSFGRRLRSRLYWRTTWCLAPVLPLLWVWFVLISIPRSLWRVAIKQPRHAAAEIVAPWWLAVRLPQAVARRIRSARLVRVPRRTLAPLLATSRELFAADRDARLARAAQHRLLVQGNDLVRAERREVSRRRRGALAVVVAGLLVATGTALRSQILGVLDGRHLVGGALLPGAGSWDQWWQAVSSGWNESGTGVSAPVDGLVTLLGPALAIGGGSMRVATGGLFVCSLLIAGLGAWFASGALTRSLAVRLWSALTWIAVPVLALGLQQGRIGGVLAHAMLPWLALTVVRTLGVQRRDQPQGHLRAVGGSFASLGASALVFAAVTASAPVLLLPGLVLLGLAALAVGTRASRRARLSLALVPLPALAVLAPMLLRAGVTARHGGWRMLFADPGGLDPYQTGEPWRMLLGRPVPALSWPSWLGPLQDIAPWALGGMLVLLAAVGICRASARGRLARRSLVVVLMGITVAVASSDVVVSVSDGSPIRGWPGAGISLATLGLMIAGCVALDGWGTRIRSRSFGWRHVTVVVLGVVCTVIPLGSLTHAVVSTHRTTEVVAHDVVVVPAVARTLQTSARRARVLALEADGSVVRYQLLRADGTTITDSSAVVAVDRLRRGDSPVAHVVAELVGGGAPQTAEVLHSYGVGAVLLPKATGDGKLLAETLDSVDGLQRATEGDRDLVWRVLTGTDQRGQASWARLVSTDGSQQRVDQLLDATASGVHDRVPAGGKDRVVRVAETAAPGWHASLDGHPLPRVDDPDGLLAFCLGPEAGTLTVAYQRTSAVWWLVLQGGVLLVFTLLALPVRRRRTVTR